MVGFLRAELFSGADAEYKGRLRAGQRVGILIIANQGLRGSFATLNPTTMKSIAPTLAAFVLTFAALTGTTPAQTVSDAKPVKIVMETSKGTIEIELDADKAPISAANFVKYVKKGFYDGVIFHRVIPDFMIQGGGFTPDMQQKETDGNIENEAKNGLKNVRGTLAMARTSVPHSASSQFFINLKDNSFLDYPGQDGWGYCVFGKVTKGMEVVDAIARVETGRKGPHGDVPLEPVTIKSAKVAE